MKLSIDSLQGVGAFTGRPVEQEITWKQGDQEFTASIFVRPIGYQSAVAPLVAGKGADPVAVRIAACICDEDGKAIFTPGDVTGEADPQRGPLDGNLAVALLVAIHEVQNAGKTTP